MRETIDVSENYNYNRINGIKRYMHENLTTQICLMGLDGRTFSCAKIPTSTVDDISGRFHTIDQWTMLTKKISLRLGYIHLTYGRELKVGRTSFLFGAILDLHIHTTSFQIECVHNIVYYVMSLIHSYIVSCTIGRTFYVREIVKKYKNKIPRHIFTLVDFRFFQWGNTKF